MEYMHTVVNMFTISAAKLAGKSGIGRSEDRASHDGR